MLCKGSERRSPSLLLYKRDSGWVLSSDVRPGCCRMALTGLAIASLAHLQPPLGEVRSPQSSSGHAKTRMHTAQSGAASAPLPCRPVSVRNTEQSTQTASASVCLVSAHSPWTQRWASSRWPARPSSRSRPRLLEDTPRLRPRPRPRPRPRWLTPAAADERVLPHLSPATLYLSSITRPSTAVRTLEPAGLCWR